MRYYLRISALFVLGKLHSKYVFEDDVSSSFAFCRMWGEEVRMQPLAKGFLFLKNAKLLEAGAYSDFISVLVSLRKGM